VQVVLSKEATGSSHSVGDSFTSRMTCYLDLRNVVYRELATEEAFSRSNLHSSAIRSSSVAHCSDTPCLGDRREKKRTRVPPFLTDNIMDFLFRMPPFVLACDWSRPGVFLDGFLSRIPPALHYLAGFGSLEEHVPKRSSRVRDSSLVLLIASWVAPSTAVFLNR